MPDCTNPDCASHNRVSRSYTDPGERIAFVDYVGSRAIYTAENDHVEMVTAALRGEEAYAFTVTVWDVGNGTLSDLLELSDAELNVRALETSGGHFPQAATSPDELDSMLIDDMRSAHARTVERIMGY